MTATIALSTTSSLPSLGREVVPLSRKHYDSLIDSGLLTPADKVELINGQLFKKMSIGSKHSGMVSILTNLLCEKLAKLATISVQNPVALHDYSEPEPDLAVLRPPALAYRTRHPEPADVFFLIEVADSSLRFDREAKVPLYAACDIPECWLVDVNAQTITVFTQPEGASYRASTEYKSGDTITLSMFPDVQIALAELGW